jgi:hypothetical protein
MTKKASENLRLFYVSKSEKITSCKSDEQDVCRDKRPCFSGKVFNG